MLLLKFRAGYYHGCMFEISSNFSAYFLKIFHVEAGTLRFWLFRCLRRLCWTSRWSRDLPPASVGLPRPSRGTTGFLPFRSSPTCGTPWGTKAKNWGVKIWSQNSGTSRQYVLAIWCHFKSKTGTALWIGKWGICWPCVLAPPPRFPLNHCSRHLRWVKTVRHRSAEHPGGDHCDDGSDREE